MSFAEYSPEAFLGRTIGGYRLIRVLGTGSSGVVFLGEEPTRIPAEVAIKISLPPLHSTQAERQVFLERFTREAEAVQHLNHPHIVPLLGSGTQDGVPFLIFPHMTGGTLAERLAPPAVPLATATIVQIATQIAQALDAAHAAGIIHRDIKSSNILFSAPMAGAQQAQEGEGNAAFLGDFGTVRLLNDAHTTLTGVGQIMGTLEYMAPEQASGLPATSASDIYGLGVVVYLMVAGRLPFSAATPLQLLAQVVQKLPPSLRQFRPDLPEAAEAAVLRALAKDPAERFSTASEFASAFALGTQGYWSVGDLPSVATSEMSTEPETVESIPSPVVENHPSTLARLPALSIITAAVLVAVLLSALVFSALRQPKGIATAAQQGSSLTQPPAPSATTTPHGSSQGSSTAATPSATPISISAAPTPTFLPAAPTPTTKPIAATPTPIPAPQQIMLYHFEDGSVWQKNGNQIMSIVSSTDYAFSGTHSNEIKLAGLTSSTYPEAFGTNHVVVPNNSTLVVEVYRPANVGSVLAQSYVVIPNGSFHGSGYMTLAAGSWTTISYALPSETFGQQTYQVGIQMMAGSGTVSGSIYVDHVYLKIGG